MITIDKSVHRMCLDIEPGSNALNELLTEISLMSDDEKADYCFGSCRKVIINTEQHVCHLYACFFYNYESGDYDVDIGCDVMSADEYYA